MLNYEFLQKYMQLQHGIMFDDLVMLKHAIIGYCRGDDSGFWNCALVNKPLKLPELKAIELELTNRGRKPSIYFEKRENLSPLINSLKDKGYKEVNEDSWMFYEPEGLKIVDRTHFDSIKRVGSDDELKAFLDTFDACYQNDDPQNPYGPLGDYLRVAEAVWRKNFNVRPIDYFIVYRGTEPVAVSTLTSYKGIGYISNVGSLKEVRGQGYGKAATLYCVERSLMRGDNEQCLATEEGNYPNKFYKRIGFKTRFLAPLYTKAPGLQK